ncbi:MAG: TPM domain-containing protein [Clostridia bacterium]|nr:TPM domain-containing protein [Clostridia bacterium]
MKSKIILFLSTVICIIALFCLNASAAENRYNDYVIDDGGLLSYSEELEISEALADVEEATGIYVRLYLHNYEYTRIDIYDYQQIAGKSFDNLVLLVVSYEYGEYYYELFTNGSPDVDITDSEADKILDNNEVYDNIKSGNLYEGISACIPLLKTALLGTLRNGFSEVFVPSLIIAIIVAVVACVIVIAKYNKKLHSPSYPLDKYARLDLNVSKDTFITRTVTRVRVSSPSRRSGGGGGGRGGGSRGRR